MEGKGLKSVVQQRSGKKGAPYLYLFAGDGGRSVVEAVKRKNDNAAAEYNLICIEVERWNDLLSPWKAPPVFGKEGFGGGGIETLEWIRTKCIPDTEGKNWEANRRIIGGYSLAGLFSLWAFYESGLFEGAICCSGSLWFPLWDEYIKGRQGTLGGKVYLSLGDREENTRNQQMKTVGERTRRQIELLQKDKAIQKATLEWNAGGHFQETNARVARGICWMLEAMK